MSDVENSSPRFGLSTVETLFAWFQRLVAVYCLIFGMFYWVRLIGYYDGPLWRFDLMPVNWQVAAVTLSAFFPFAAIGLWMLASWGPVIWFICAVDRDRDVRRLPAHVRPSLLDRRDPSSLPPASTRRSGSSCCCRSGVLTGMVNAIGLAVTVR